MVNNNWILVTDSLPDVGENVEVLDSNLGITKATLNHNSEWIEFVGAKPLINVEKWRRI